MSLGKGWIKLHRQSEENPLYFSEPFDRWHAWQDLLLTVNHERKQFISKGQLITLEPGQTVTSDRILAQRWRWSREKVRRFLKLLNETSMCDIKRTTNGTILTIVNWGKFQGTQTTDETTNETTGKTTNKTTDETLTRMIKNDKEGKEGGGRTAPTLSSPTLEEIRQECRTQKYDAVDPEKFFSYYEARRWKLGGEFIDWRAMLRKWDLEDRDKAPKKEHIDSNDIRDIVANVMKRREAERDDRRGNGTGN